MIRLSLWLCWIYLCAGDDISEQKVSSKFKIAVIGGGISGSFVTKYLSDYDTGCSLDITVFDRWSPDSDESGYAALDNNIDDSLDPSFGQGSRVYSWTSPGDGRTIELGAEKIHEGYRLIQQMIDNDQSLMKIFPSSINDIGIFHSPNNPLLLNLHNRTISEKHKLLLLRYNLDYYLLHKAAQQTLQSFEEIYDILDSKDQTSFLESPNDVWKAVGLSYPSSVSFHQYLDYKGISSRISWWRNIFGDQGQLRDELLNALNLANYRQSNNEITGLAALMNYISFTGRSFSIDGGNQKIIKSAFFQAKTSYETNCRNESIVQIKKKIGTVVSHYEKGFEVFDTDGKTMGIFDIVVLAVPLQLSGINFLCKGSLFDSSVLHDMPLNGMIDGENSDANEHGHIVAFGAQVPLSLKIPYTQIVTTLVGNGILNNTFIGVQQTNVPRSVYVTKNGENRIQMAVGITKVGDNFYKILSAEELNDAFVKTLFGEKAVIEKVKVWGGKNAGAVPTFNGGEEFSYSSKFLLYDGGHGISAYSKASALYYTNAMESAASSMEISAIGSMFVAKHLSKRLGLLQEEFKVKDEL